MRALGLQHLQLREITGSTGPSDGRTVRHRTDELFVKQHTVTNRQTTSVKEDQARPVFDPPFFLQD